uniref:Acyl-CoA thioesterase 8 n=1 Tax=Plectus sambesii TaxID=2011161 RepID=A0A914V0B5_9BILA
AAKTITPAYNVHSLHSYFLKAGNVNKPILYSIDRVRDGRSFCTRCVKAVQDGEALYTSEISFHKAKPHSIEHQSPMPKVAQPGDLRDGKEVIRDCLADPKVKLDKFHRAFLERRLDDFPSTFDIKPVCPDSYLLLKPSEPRFFTWVKAVGHIGSDDRLHQCVAAYISDSSMVGTALLPHLARGFIPSMLFSLDHSIWFHHHKFRIDDWMLYETESPIARM